ncbi:BnaA06g33080D [Brassica napus]|uniref:BnaA06g33080D protein n=1 Tax=Brassica napus TaxID=3708 RepID=A0A078FGR5_BRANA|nr:BnaA06g33080D [Brassica napus]
MKTTKMLKRMFSFFIFLLFSFEKERSWRV